MISLQLATGDILRQLRHDRSMTLRDVSSKSYIAIGYLSEVERGDKSPSLSMLEQIGKGLDISTTDLVERIYLYLKEQNTLKDSSSNRY